TLLELMQYARLAHTRLADDRDQVRCAISHDALEHAFQLRELGLAADQRHAQRAPRHGGGGVDRFDHLPGRDRLGLPLQRERLELAVAHSCAAGTASALTDE